MAEDFRELGFRAYGIGEEGAPEPAAKRVRRFDGLVSTIHVDTRLRLETDSNELFLFAAAEGGGYHFAALRMGAGAIVITGRPYFLENDFIGEHDNPLWAWRLLAGNEKQQPVLFAFSRRAGSSRHSRTVFYIVLAGIAVFLGLLVWYSSARSGAPLSDLPQSGSDISRRLSAEGSFFWKYRQSTAIVEACRSGAIQAARRKGAVTSEGRPDWYKVAQVCDVEAEVILSVVGQTPKTRKKTIQAIRLYKHIEETL
jgi:hypothetical protein